MKRSKHSRYVIEIILLVLICVFLLWLSANQVISHIKKNMMDEMTDVEKNLTNVMELYDEAIDNQERVQKHLARLGAYYLKMTKDPLSQKTLERLQNILDTEAVYILDENGKILQSSDNRNDNAIPEDKRESLAAVTAKKPYSAVMIEKSADPDNDADNSDPAASGESGYDIYYSYYLDPGHILVLGEDYIDYSLSLKADNSLYDVLNRSRFGKNGFYFMVTPEGSLSFSNFTIFDESQKIEVPENGFHNGSSGIFSIDGRDYFCTLKEMEGTEVYLACALPLSEVVTTLISASVATVAFVLAALLLMYFYAYIIVLESSKKKNRQTAFKSFRNRLAVLTFLCIIVTSGITIYLHTLYIYSSALSSNAVKSEELQNTIAPLDEIRELGSDQYQKTVRAFTKAAASLISRDPAFYERKKLKKLAVTLCADHILIYNESGRVIASDQNYTGITLSDDPDDMSYDFQWVIRGDPLLIQEKPDREHLNQHYLFSGASLKDETGDCIGLVQLAIPPSFREDMVVMTSIDSVLSSFYDRGDTIPFAVDSESQKVYSAYKPFNNLRAKELGFTENELRDEYTGFFILQKQELLGSCQTSGDYWAIIASFTDDYPVDGARSSVPMIIGTIIIEFLFLFFLLLRMKENGGLISADGIHLFDDKKISTARAETHIIRIIGTIAFIFATTISLIAFLGPALFQKGTPGYYVFVYPWSKEFSIFTFTRCLIIICVVGFALSITLKFLELLASLLSSRQETILRLVISFLRYFGWIGAIYYCLTLLGVPTISLLASAGALTAIFSIGAQNIVADILAGLFIIFEGSFKVGDMITVDDWHGQVQEIGIRNTTIRDLINNDVKILNNSTIKRVVNNSIYPSFCAMKIGIPYGMDLRELEEIIEKELPVMQEDLADRIEAFRYLGVDEFADSSVIIKFEVACRNQDFNKVKRALNREIKLMFDRNDISVPFPQVVLHNESDNKDTQS